MKCSRCQAENREGRRFCGECGASLALTCSSCGFSNEPSEKFCGGCGQALAPAAAPASKFASPDSYTPKHLAEKIFTSKSALEGERKQVTVLFADLKGSMELLADRDPEEARKLLDPVLERMMEAVHRYEGTVNQVMGDGIMALFGAPLAHEDHAVRACYAALRMQESVRQYADETQRREGLPVNIRVGLNSGEVVVRAIGSDLHMDYTAVGQTTHLAARMEQMAQPGSILVTGDVLRLAEGYVQVKPLGPVHIKGLSDSLEVYEVIGTGLTRTRFQAAALRGMTRFVGRDPEIAQLHQALDRTGAGHGQVVALVGEPGVGKSRLVWEFTHSHRAHGWLVLESGSVSYGKATPYLPVTDLLKGYFKIRDRDDQREVRDRVIGRLFGLDRALEATLPAILGLLDVPIEDPQWQTLDPPQRRQRTLDATKRLVLRESQVQPLLLVLEDLHWIDGETQAFLDSLIDSLPTARILLLVNYRPEYEHQWGRKTYYTQLRLDPLPPESADELLQALLGTDDSVQPLKPVLIERTEGNPFFLEESVRTLVETQALVGERGAYRVAKPLGDIRVPTTVQAVLAARIDRLPAEHKRLLQAASVIGKDVPFALLQPIAELPEKTLRQALTHLQADEFLYETSLFPELEYTFKHALTHEVAYGSLLQERRRVLHARVVDAIERFYPDRLAEHVERLAHHAFQSEVWGKALPYLRQAGTKALVRSASREAVACFEQALLALRHLPESRDTVEQAIDLRFDLRSALYPLAELERILDYLREAERLAGTLDDQRRLARVSGYVAQLSWALGDYQRAVEVGQRALTVAGAVEDLALQVVPVFALLQGYYALGDYRQAMNFSRKNVESLKGDLVGERFGLYGFPSVFSRAWLAWCLAELGEFPNGISCGEEAIRIAEALDHPFSLTVAYWGVGGLYLRKGEFHKTISVLDHALELCRTWNFAFLFPWTASCLGYAYALSGRIGDALPLIERAVNQAVTMKTRAYHSLSVAFLGEAHLLAGRVDDSRELAGRALELSRGRKERGHEAWSLRLLGEIASHRGVLDAENGTEHYRQALALAHELGMRPLLARCHLGLGKLYRRTGDRPKAQEHLTTATTMLREMDMRFWREQAEAEVKALGSTRTKKARRRT